MSPHLKGVATDQPELHQEQFGAIDDVGLSVLGFPDHDLLTRHILSSAGVEAVDRLNGLC